MNAGKGPDPREHRDRFASALSALRDEATSIRGDHLTSAKICAEVGADRKRFSAWVKGDETPSSELDDLVHELIVYMERHIEERTGGRPVRTRQQWDALLRLAQKEGRRNQGRRKPNAGRPTGPAPFRFVHAAKGKDRPPELAGRQDDLDRLCELVSAKSRYLSLVAPPWAGKTAFLASFAASHVPENIDLVAYFVQWRSGGDTAQRFLDTMVIALSRHIGRKPPSLRDTATLLDLYEAAAKKSVKNDRRLLLLVDGLDLDSVSYLDGESIASLLPPELHPGLVVLVSRRWHPPIPGDVPSHHPLRHAERITNFRPSPEAAVRREEVLRNLVELLKDKDGWGREVVGFLAVAHGGLTENALTELIGRGLIPFDLTERLYSVAGRGLCLGELEPDAFVLAHRDLYEVALAQLSDQMCSDLRQRLHTWADGYREYGWPGSTPGYLLHDYLSLLRHDDASERRFAFTLDHRRLLRLASKGRVDLALSSLDHVACGKTPAILASAAASRSLLETMRRHVPREVLRALCLVGDVERARALALAPGDPVSKAVRLLEMAQALSGTATGEAEEQVTLLAREAAAWAEQAEQHPFLTFPMAEWDTVAIVARTAAVLAELGMSDEAGRLLGTVDVCRPENVEPSARTAERLRKTDRVLAERVLDELLLEAESQAEPEEGDPVFAVGIWASVAAHDHERADRILPRMREFSKAFVEASPGLAAADCCALTASALAQANPGVVRAESWDQARELAEIARKKIQAALVSLPADETSESLALVVQAYLDLEEPHDDIRRMLAEFPPDVAVRATSLLDDFMGEPVDVAVADEPDLLEQAKRLSDLGDGPQLKNRLDQFTRAVAELETYVPWLPFLAEALPSTGGDVDTTLASLTGERPDSVQRIRVLASAAKAFAQARRHGEAVWCATEAAASAERLDSHRPEVRALVAQAFAHVGDAENATSWARPADGKRPTGKPGIPYRRAALAVQAGLDPASFVDRIVSDGLPGSGGPSSAGTELLAAFSSVASGARAEAHLASLRTSARARLSTGPLTATGLALLQAVLGNSEEARRTIDEIPDAAARGVAQATVAGLLSSTPVYLDMAGGEDCWTLSALRVIAHRLYPAGTGEAALTNELVVQALGTTSWYWTLPLLGRMDPEAVHKVIEVLDHHWQVGVDMNPLADLDSSEG
ncbi:hypothetical protein [Actinomadura hibisca]|uniref:hypothetical protein n=1 Tax=Actinomadura hibisca TaxID=68565 RepID=UPI000834B2F6|nr:hypothetical protein [Actinomadura hibisca]